MQSQQSIYFHYGEVVAEQNKRGNVDHILGPVPKMGEQFRCPSRQKPNEVTNDDIPESETCERSLNFPSQANAPPGQVVATLVDGDSRLVDNVADEEGTREQREGVEQLVHL